MAKLVQVALCTSDMPRTIRTFVEVLGFSSAGGRPRWGAHAARLQELPTGDDTYVMLWWLVGRQRFGGVVPDFDRTLQRLEAAGFPTMTPPVEVNGLRRVCFREPGSLSTVEVM